MDGAEQVANIAAQCSAPSPTWQPLNEAEVQLCDNKKGKKPREDLEKNRKPLEALRAVLYGCWSTA